MPRRAPANFLKNFGKIDEKNPENHEILTKKKGVFSNYSATYVKKCRKNDEKFGARGHLHQAPLGTFEKYKKVQKSIFEATNSSLKMYQKSE